MSLNTYMLRRVAALLLALAAFPPVASGQITFTLTGYDASAYPSIKVRFDALDRFGDHIVNFTPSDFTVMEDGVARTVTSVSCPPPRTPPISITLVVDISYSMSLLNRLTYAKVAASEMVRSLDYPPAATGIVTFDDTSSIHLPYTSDSTAILNSIASLQATGGGTDFLGSFVDKVTGSLDFTRNRPGTKYIIFLTDGAQDLTTAYEQQIILAAQAADIRIYTITLTANQLNWSLRRIAIPTGGQWYEGITTQAQVEDVFRQILRKIYYYDPCELTYLSAGCETNRNVDITLRKNNATATRSLAVQIPPASIMTLDASNTLLDFGIVPIGGNRTMDLVLTARNGAVTIQSIGTPLSAFTIVNYGGSSPPFTLQAGQSRTIRVRYFSGDTIRTVTLLDVRSDAPCEEEVVLAAGSYYPDALVLVQPNGGEVLYSGTSYDIRWKGVPRNQVVELEYSTDAGTSWRLITPAAYSYSTLWGVPNTPSDSCLGLVRTPDSRTASKDASWLPLQPSEVLDLAFTPSGTLLAAALIDGRIKLYYPATGALVDILAGHTARVNAVAFSFNGLLLASASADGTVRVWDAITGALLQTLTDLGGQVHSVAFTRDGTSLVAANQASVARWRTADWGLEWSVAGNTVADGSIALSPRNQWIASSAGNDVAILRYSDGGFIRSLTGHSAPVRALAASNDNAVIASGSDDRTIRLWNTVTWTQLRVLSGHTNGVTSVNLTSAGLYVISSSRDRTVRVWDARDPAPAPQTFSAHSADVNAVRFDTRAGVLASAGVDRTVRIWGYSAPLADLSDSLWAIVTPVTTLVAEVPEFAPVICPDTFTDDSITVVNKGNQIVTVLSHAFTGPDSMAFSFTGGFSIPPVRALKPEDTLVIPLRFFPTGSRDYVANLRLNTDAATDPHVDIPLTGHKDSAGVVPAPDTLDAGELYSCTIPAGLSFVLTNTGTVNARVDSLGVTGPNIADFSGNIPRTLSPGAADTVHVRVFPVIQGPFVTTLSLGFTPCNGPLSLVVRGVLSPSTPEVFPSAVRFPFTSVGDTSYQTFKLKNPTGVDMLIESAALATSPFLIVSPAAFPVVIPPRDSITIRVAFLPDTPGASTASILFQAGTPCRDSVAVTLDGSSTRKPEIATAGGTFRALLCADEQSADTVVTVTNTGGDTLDVSSMTIGGANPSEFTLLSSTPMRLAPGQSAQVRLRFSAAGIGPKTASLTILSNAATNPTLSVPLSAVKDSAGLLIAPARIDLGEIHVCNLPVRRSVTIHNTGSVPLDVRVDTSGLSVAMHLSSAFPPRSIPAGDSVRVDIDVTPTSFGALGGGFSVSAIQCTLSASALITGRYSDATPVLSTNSLDFGSLGSGATSQRTVRVTNPTGRPMRITRLALPTGVSVRVDSPAVLPAVIAPGQALDILLTYNPASTDTLRAELKVIVDQPCSDSVTVTLTGRANAAFSDLSLPDMTATVGDIIRIPLRMERSANLELNGATSFRAEIVYNRSLLFPRSVTAAGGTAAFTSQAEEDSLLRVTVTVVRSAAPSDGAIAELECLVMLGTSGYTRLGLPAFTWTNGSAAVTTRDGSLNIDGICEAGGRRLMALPGGILLFTNIPNPFNPSTTILFTLESEQTIDLRVYDALGKEIAAPAAGAYAAGTHAVPFLPGRDASGILYCVLRTGTETRTLPMIFLK